MLSLDTKVTIYQALLHYYFYDFLIEYNLKTMNRIGLRNVNSCQLSLKKATKDLCFGNFAKYFTFYRLYIKLFRKPTVKYSF